MSQHLASTARTPEQHVAVRRYNNNISLLNELFPVFHTARAEVALGANDRERTQFKAPISAQHSSADTGGQGAGNDAQHMQQRVTERLPASVSQ